MDWLWQGIVITCLSAFICVACSKIWNWMKKKYNSNAILDFYIPLVGYTAGVVALSTVSFNFDIKILVIDLICTIFNLGILINFSSKK